MSCYKFQLGVQQEKCKFCLYYVVVKRLFYQYMRFYFQDMYFRQKEVVFIKFIFIKKMFMFFFQLLSGTLKRYKCNICFYIINSKNDFFYYKQFYRQKFILEFKCDYCDYWVIYRRLINQYMKMYEVVGYFFGNVSFVFFFLCKFDIIEFSVI